MNSQGCKVSGGKIYFPEAYDSCPFCGTKLAHENEHEKAPSKQRHDRLRSLHRDSKMQQRRKERLRLFGYIELRNGEVITIDEARAFTLLRKIEIPVEVKCAYPPCHGQLLRCSFQIDAGGPNNHA